MTERHTGNSRVTTVRHDQFLQIIAKRHPNAATQFVLKLQSEHQVLVRDQTVRGTMDHFEFHYYDEVIANEDYNGQMYIWLGTIATGIGSILG